MIKTLRINFPAHAIQFLDRGGVVSLLAAVSHGISLEPARETNEVARVIINSQIIQRAPRRKFFAEKAGIKKKARHGGVDEEFVKKPVAQENRPMVA